MLGVSSDRFAITSISLIRFSFCGKNIIGHSKRRKFDQQHLNSCFPSFLRDFGTTGHGAGGGGGGGYYGGGGMGS